MFTLFLNWLFKVRGFFTFKVCFVSPVASMGKKIIWLVYYILPKIVHINGIPLSSYLFLQVVKLDLLYHGCLPASLYHFH